MNDYRKLMGKAICFCRFLMDAVWYVPKFAWLMRVRLWQNRHKGISGNWRKDPAWRWLARAQDEIKELRAAMDEEIRAELYPFTLEEAQEKRKLEAVDVGNFAMFAAFAEEIDG